MFGLFSRKKKAKSAMDELIFAIYGNPPPAKRANVGEAVKIANGLLMGLVNEIEVSRIAIALNDGPVPYSTHDLGLSVALNFFQRPENVGLLSEAQLFARMSLVGWLQKGLIAPVLAKSFESVLYNLYKPSV